MKHLIGRLWHVSRLVAPLLVAVLLARCAPVDALNATIDVSGLRVTRDVAYMDGPRGMLDVWRPEAATGPLPVVVFFYGGAWNSGRRGDYVFVAAALARAGMVVVVPDYRLSPGVRFPVFLQDAAAAVAFARRTAPAWGGDPGRLVLAGHSAGAHIAAMLALDPEYLAAAGDDRARLAGMVGISGPYDFLPITGADVKTVFAGAEPSRTQPVTYADGRNPPMLLLHGTADDTVYLRNSVNLAAAIRAHGGPVEVKTYPGLGHIGAVIAFAPIFAGRAPVLDDVARFVAALPPVSGAPAAFGSAGGRAIHGGS